MNQFQCANIFGDLHVMKEKASLKLSEGVDDVMKASKLNWLESDSRWRHLHWRIVTRQWTVSSALSVMDSQGLERQSFLRSADDARENQFAGNPLHGNVDETGNEPTTLIHSNASSDGAMIAVEGRSLQEVDCAMMAHSK